MNIDVEGVEDDGQNMYNTTYLTKLRNTPISSKSVEEIIEDLDVMMARIYKRIRKWVEWTTTWKKQSKVVSNQSTPDVATTLSSPSNTSYTTPSLTQG